MAHDPRTRRLASLMLAVLLAAGRGTRLKPLTDSRSKAMLPVAGEPMVGRVLDMLIGGGAEAAVVVAHPGDSDLLHYLREPPYAARTRVVFQEQRLGMAHAVECASPLVRDTGIEEFLLASCDNLYPPGHVERLIAHRRQASLDAALTLLWTTPEQATASAVAVLRNGFVTEIIEKPTPTQIPVYEHRQEALSVPSLYALSTRILDYLPRVSRSPRGEMEFPDALRLLIADGGRVAGTVVGTRTTLTQPRDLLTLNQQFLHEDPSRAAIEAPLPAAVTIEAPVRIDEKAIVGSGCSIGPATYLEGGCRVDGNAVVRHSIVLRGGTVDAGETVVDSVISADGRIV